MAEEIINRVADSKLVTFNLEDHYPAGERVLFDIKDWLLEGFVLRERVLGKMQSNMTGVPTRENSWRCIALRMLLFQPGPICY